MDVQPPDVTYHRRHCAASSQLSGVDLWDRNRSRISVSWHLPGEAALAVAASLLGRQHEGVGPAGEQQVPNLEGSGDPQSSTFPRAVEPLQPLHASRHDCCVPPETTRRPRGKQQSRREGGRKPHPQGPGGEVGFCWASPSSPQQQQAAAIITGRVRWFHADALARVARSGPAHI